MMNVGRPIVWINHFGGLRTSRLLPTESGEQDDREKTSTLQNLLHFLNESGSCPMQRTLRDTTNREKASILKNLLKTKL